MKLCNKKRLALVAMAVYGAVVLAHVYASAVSGGQAQAQWYWVPFPPWMPWLPPIPIPLPC